MMLPKLVVVGCIKQSVDQYVKPPPPPAWIMQPPDCGPAAERLFHPQKADHYAKQLEGTQKYINEQYGLGLPISMGNIVICARAFCL